MNNDWTDSKVTSQIKYKITTCTYESSDSKFISPIKYKIRTYDVMGKNPITYVCYNVMDKYPYNQNAACIGILLFMVMVMFALLTIFVKYLI
jgi:hypothetical protein